MSDAARPHRPHRPCRGRRRKRVVADDDDDDGGGGGGDDPSNGVRVVGTRVFFFCDVTPRSVVRLSDCLHEANKRVLSRHKDADARAAARVRLLMLSPGGDVFSGLAAMDIIRHNIVPVVTIAVGMVASSATFLFLAGKRRLISPHGFVLIHQLSLTGFDGKYADLVDEMHNSRDLMTKITDLYRDRTKMSAKKVHAMLRCERAMDATACVKAGVAHAKWTRTEGR